ncbi:SLC13 family permease [Shewanella sp. AS16]|uniref:SLC13 family permease n=1 Tax=Shewanella sp. AS16 TaxID=2907625 RepID=UPI001F2B46CC|nr:SLC13 family permease [Shewanella sp. AS16]MCE9686916.1 SLC13 family permease [Shewanella sp. AS16]
MSAAQLILISVLIAAMGMFLWGRWRHDVVAMAALLICIFTGVVPAEDAFGGFAHPAVITVACVLVLGHGLQQSGAMNLVAKRLLPTKAGPTLSILLLLGLAALLSAFMNNVGALALLMPIAIQMAAKLQLPAGKVLMPLAFGSVLGGMTTLIGTPPNLIVSSFRQAEGLHGFSMFDFSPVGFTVAFAGVLFIGLLGWRLVPTRKQTGSAGFDTGTYLSEVRIVEGSKAEKMSLQDAERLLDEADAQIVALVRREVRISAPSPRLVLRAGDILVLEVEPGSLPAAFSSLGLKFEAEVAAASKEAPEKQAGAATPAGGKAETAKAKKELEQEQEDGQETKAKQDEVALQELVVMPNAALVNRSATNIDLRSRYGINLLAISRQGQRSIRRLRTTQIQAGDVLLVQGTPEALGGFASQFGCLPLAERDIRVPQMSHALPASLIMALAVLLAALGILPTAVAFAAGALAFVILGIVPLRSIYTSVDWPVVVLLAAMLPIADAMETTGMADMAAKLLLQQVAQDHAIAGLVLLLVLTMFLSDLMNNAATAAVMCPIGISTAMQLGVSADAFLMAIAVGASCAFLTPIGHQNNTLILGPGGFRFGDYWRMGLMLEIIVVAVSVPMLLWVWPL